MNKTPPGTISSRSTSKREKRERERKREIERASQGMPTWPRVPSRCRTFLHSARIIAREDERGNDRSIYICFSDFADFKCKLGIIGVRLLLLERDYGNANENLSFSPSFQFARIETNEILFLQIETKACM